MNDMEQRARALLAAEYDAVNRWEDASGVRKRSRFHEPGVRAIVAALSQQQAVPTGFVLVPVEPSGEMIDACNSVSRGGAKPPNEMTTRARYKAMLAARPEVQG